MTCQRRAWLGIAWARPAKANLRGIGLAALPNRPLPRRTAAGRTFQVKSALPNQSPGPLTPGGQAHSPPPMCAMYVEQVGLAEPGLQHLELGLRVTLEGDEEQPGRELAGVRVLAVGVVVTAPEQPDSAVLVRGDQSDVSVHVDHQVTGVGGFRIVDGGEFLAAGDR